MDDFAIESNNFGAALESQLDGDRIAKLCALFGLDEDTPVQQVGGVLVLELLSARERDLEYLSSHFPRLLSADGGRCPPRVIGRRETGLNPARRGDPTERTENLRMTWGETLGAIQVRYSAAGIQRVRVRRAMCRRQSNSLAGGLFCAEPPAPRGLLFLDRPEQRQLGGIVRALDRDGILIREAPVAKTTL